MTVCCYVFRKSKPITFKTSFYETIKAYRLVYSHNSEQENWGDYWSANEWQEKESRKLKRLRKNSYPLKSHQFFVTSHDEKATMLDLWIAGPAAQKAWDDCNDMPGVWIGKLTKKSSGRGWDYHSRAKVKMKIERLIMDAFRFIGIDPKLEDTLEGSYDKLLESQRKDHDYAKAPRLQGFWDRRNQMSRQRYEIEVWGSNLWDYERKTKAASAV